MSDDDKITPSGKVFEPAESLEEVNDRFFHLVSNLQVALSGLTAEVRALRGEVPAKTFRQVAKTFECPECGAPMVPRMAGGEQFAGCSTYPKCRGSRGVDGDRTTARAARREDPPAAPAPPEGEHWGEWTGPGREEKIPY